MEQVQVFQILLLIMSFLAELPAVKNMANKLFSGKDEIKKLYRQAFMNTINKVNKEYKLSIKKKDCKDFFKSNFERFKNARDYHALNSLMKQCLFGKHSSDQASLYMRTFNQYITDEINSMPDLKNYLNNFSIKSLEMIIDAELITPPPFQLSPQFYEHPSIEAIKNMFRDVPRIVLTGMGGIGKTTVCQKLFWDLRRNILGRNFDYIGWITYSGDWKNSLLTTKWNKIIAPIKHEAIIDFINKNNVLLFVDNVYKTLAEDSDLKDLFRLNNVIITSRRRLEGIPEHPIKLLDENDASELFIKYYCAGGQTGSPEEVRTKYYNVVSEIIKLAGRHTMTIEILAKQAKQIANNPNNLETFKNKLDHVGFDLTDLPVRVIRNDQEYEGLLIDHLKKLFDLNQLSAKQLKILRNFTVLPDDEINVEALDIRNLLHPTEWSYLIDHGWMRQERGYYTVHKVIKEIVKKEGNITIDDCRQLTQVLSQKLNIDTTHSIREIIEFIPYGKSIYEFFMVNHNNDIDFGNLAFYLFDNYIPLDNRHEAYDGMETAIQIVEKYTESQPYDEDLIFELARKYCTFGYTCIDNTDHFQDAISYLNKSEQLIDSLTLQPDLDRVNLLKARIYSNRGAALLKLKNHCDSPREKVEEALVSHQEAYRIRKEYYDNDPQNKTYIAALATSITTIGVDYYYLGDLDEAIKRHKEALELRKSIFDDNNEYIAISNNYIGGALCDIAKSLKHTRERRKKAREALNYLNPALIVMQDIGKQTQIENQTQIKKIKIKIDAANKILGE